MEAFTTRVFFYVSLSYSAFRYKDGDQKNYSNITTFGLSPYRKRLSFIAGGKK
jgi:hypothetical protein